MPFFPALQASLDDLIWRGALRVERLEVGATRPDDATTRAWVEIVESVARPALGLALTHPDENEASNLYLEVALATARVGDLGDVVSLDASYSNPAIGLNRLVDLGAVQPRNSAGLAERIGELVSERGASRGEKVALYIGHLSRVAGSNASA